MGKQAKQLKGMRYPLLKHPARLKPGEERRLAALRRQNRALGRAYELKECLAAILGEATPEDGQELLDEWLAWASRSRLAPFVKLAKTVRKHAAGILAYLDTKMTNGIVEGINNKLRVIARRAYGFHSHGALISMLFLCCGGIQLAPPLPTRVLGDSVFRFGLKEAIGHCLVEYDYYIHPVQLTPDEHDDWASVTATIKANAWRQEHGDPDDYLLKLLRDRRAILENAENKIAALNIVLEREDPRTIRHALIYTSDKGPKQLTDVNALLQRHRVQYHQLTSDETTSRTQTARILRSFRDGTLRVLTAKRVLDEGVNIPQIQTAFLLASTTVERQWIQRRGRLLRQCSDPAKTHAAIHDFVALPPHTAAADADDRAIVRSELARAQEFASLARNAGRPDGPLPVIRKLTNMTHQ